MRIENDSSTHIALRSARRANWMAGIALFLVLMICAFGVLLSWWLGERDKIMQPRITQDTTGDVNIWVKHTPIVITHLEHALYKTAALDPPLAVDRGAADINLARQQILRLDWRDENGKKVSPPAPNEKLSALYYQPQRAQQTNSD